MDDKRTELETELLRRKIAEEEQYIYEDYRNRQRKKWISYAIALAPLPIAIATVLDISDTLRFPLYAATASLFVAVLFIYLQPSRVSRYISSPNANDFKDELVIFGRKNRELEKQNRDLKKKIDQIINQLQNGEGGEKLFSKEDKQEIQARIQAKIESEQLQEYKNHLVGIIEQELSSRSLDSIFEQTSSRIESEIQNQAKRGNVNLLLGITTTLTGVGILGYSVFNAPQAETAISLASHFIPRISLVLLIEVFAYFFLKLYKQSLIEIKYFQNELTNIESKYLGVRLANGDDSSHLSDAINQLLSTERNFILEKGQTTVDLEKDKIDTERTGKLTATLDKAIAKIK
ncbi:hypothetical protein M2G36_20885 [Vibrio vulnificus]|uniref:hypothetical protein n=1 Tax=Vibrio parahaemolyticus TaxID=670 RepID=UPI001D16DDF9|nr:hypothetical protein [Vibrio parahaemolyticus]MCU8562220.1 hypothetical protein [Vibrio vulnificus]EIV8646511.1 hypothetical protein [Vibrio parahaemolyticus]EIV8675417.1 hypothetical protein [Vibrio parahaemolyticus]MCC3795209.1 hypothetical protein [Vibrio parahaemolyticus]MCC3809051.1 hypothetical protein [Vibrio parahaemolyticus]